MAPFGMDSFDETHLFGDSQLSVATYRESMPSFEPREIISDSDTDSSTISICFSEADLISDAPSWDAPLYQNRPHSARNAADNDDDDDEQAILPTFAYALSDPKYQTSKFAYSKTVFVSQQHHSRPRSNTRPKTEERPDRSSKRLSRSFTSISRRSTSRARRSPSPKKRDDAGAEGEYNKSSSSSKADTPGGEEAAVESKPPQRRLEQRAPKAASYRHSMLATFKRDTSSSGSPGPDSTTPVTSDTLGRSKSHRSDYSMATSSSIQSHFRNKLGRPPTPKTTGAVAVTPLSHQYFYPTDDLAPAFRAIEVDFQKLESKTTTIKAGIVRTSLLTFLRKTANHPSNKRVRPEYLDRRIKILSRWWTAMLDMLQTKEKQSVSAVDRLTLFEGIGLIMERPEWRAPPSPFCSLADRAAFAKATGVDPDAELPDDLDFVLEAVSHDVKNSFVQNLFSQVVFVLDRMSQRNTPTNLVKFCGKTCAYAFLFCPGVAEILVRHWHLSASIIKRTFAAYDIEDDVKLEKASQRVQRLFPQCIDSLVFKSAQAAITSLKKKPILPLGLERLKAHGAWRSRWSGKESDLFFTFVEHYHRLAAEFLPIDATKTEIACVPAALLVHAQILATLDTVFRRNSSEGNFDPAKFTKATSFDDVLAAEGQALGSDSLAALLAKASKSLTENSLIVLLRAFLSDKGATNDQVAKFFTQGFTCVLKAATQATSLYDQSACFTLLDFLQEAFVAIIQYENTTSVQGSLLDWSFWVDVFKKMISSQNTMTEMRLYSFIFTMWDYLEQDIIAKEKIALEFLLDEEVFCARFTHWCPLVRAFYHRLLCWRLARPDGSVNESNLRVFGALMTRLLTLWSHFKFLQEKAEVDGTMPPSTTPCNPAPGRRLLIIRTDLMNNGSPNTSHGGVPQRQSSLAVGPEKPALSEKSTNTPNGAPVRAEPMRKRNSGLWNLIASRQNGEAGSPPNETTQATIGAKPNSDGVGSRSSMYTSRPAATMAPINKPSSLKVPPGVVAKAATTPPVNQVATFKFSMEYVGTRPHASMMQVSLIPPKIPSAAFECLKARARVEDDVPAAEPPKSLEHSMRYVGRALSEWALIVNEFQNFVDRRRREGVAFTKDVETPILAVDPIKRGAGAS